MKNFYHGILLVSCLVIGLHCQTSISETGVQAELRPEQTSELYSYLLSVQFPCSVKEIPRLYGYYKGAPLEFKDDFCIITENKQCSRFTLFITQPEHVPQPKTSRNTIHYFQHIQDPNDIQILVSFTKPTSEGQMSTALQASGWQELTVLEISPKEYVLRFKRRYGVLQDEIEKLRLALQTALPSEQISLTVANNAPCRLFYLTQDDTQEFPVWQSKEEETKNIPARIPDDAIILLMYPEYISELKSAAKAHESAEKFSKINISNLPKIVLKSTISQQALERVADKSVLASIDLNATHRAHEKEIKQIKDDSFGSMVIPIRTP